MNRGYITSAHFACMFLWRKAVSTKHITLVILLSIAMAGPTTAEALDDFAGCISHVNGVLNQDCEFTATAGMFLQGDPGCDDYIVRIKNPVTGGFFPTATLNLEHVGQTFEVSIEGVGDCGFAGCWGTLSLEDKNDPLFPDPCEEFDICDEDLSCLDWDPITRRIDFDGRSLIDSVKKYVEFNECSALEFFQYDIIYKKAKEDCNDPDTVIYHFNAKDIYGNGASIDYIFRLNKVEITSVEFPGVYYGDCSDESFPDSTGLPLINGEEIDVFPGPRPTEFCNLIVSYWDKEIPECREGCSKSKSLLRGWTILDWCNSQLYEGEQLIGLRDTLPPVIDSIPLVPPFSTDPWDCKRESLELPIPFISDNCDIGDVAYQVLPPEGVFIEQLPSGHYVAKHVPKGTYSFYYVAIDCCENISDPFEYRITVQDQVNPEATAKEFSVISLAPRDSSGIIVSSIAKMKATDLDNGSWDNCGDLQFYVRRKDGDPNNCDNKDFFPLNWKDLYETIDSAILFSYDEIECRTADNLKVGKQVAFGLEGVGTGQSFCNDFGKIQYNGDEWGEFVAFCCEDVYSNGTDTDEDGDGFKNEHQIELIVFDSEGNWNITWGWVKVEDPTPPEFVIERADFFCHDPYSFRNDEREIQLEARELVSASTGCVEELRFSDVEGPFFMSGGALSMNPNPSRGEDPHPSLFGDQVDFEYHGNFSWQTFNRTCKYGYGWIRYTARSIKGIKVAGYQLIKVSYKDNFSCASIYWPEEDHIITDCENVPVKDTLTWDAGPCELIGWTYSSDTFRFESDACRKIINEYTVINWCVNDWYNDQDGHTTKDFPKLWTGSENAVNGSTGDCNIEKDHDGKPIGDTIRIPSANGIYKYKQIIKIVDTIPPIIANPGDRFYPIIGSTCDVEINISNSAFDPSECLPVAYNWELLVDYDHDGDFDDSFRRRGMDIFITLPNRLSGPMDSITARWKVWDGCGNSDLADFKIYSIDEKPPTPYCIDLSSALMVDPDGDGPRISMVELWAADFDRNSSDVCYGTNLFFTFDNVPFIPKYTENEHYYTKDGLIFAIVFKNGKIRYYDANENEIPDDSQFLEDVRNLYLDGLPYEGNRIYRWLPPGTEPNLTKKYTAGTVFNSTYTDGNAVKDNDVIITVWDGKFNNDYCLVNLTLRCQDCTDGEVATIAGVLATEDNDRMDDVKVSLVGISNPDYKKHNYTVGGGYAFPNTPMYESYDIYGVYDEDHDKGITTMDLLLIQRHILGLTLFESPYKIIASDASNDRKVTGTDIIILRKLILGYYDKLPGSTSFKFINAHTPLNLEEVLIDYQEVININTLDANRMEENFIAIKVGDVNGDAFNLRNTQIRSRSNNNLVLTLDNKKVTTGEVISIPFRATSGTTINGYQVELILNGLEYQGVRPGQLEFTDENIANFDEVLRMSYFEVEEIALTGDLFYLSFTVTKDGELNEMISLGTGIKNEAIVDQINSGQVELRIGDSNGINALYQNEPNPFNEFTDIGFYLEKAGNASLTIHNVEGKELRTIEGNYPSGYNKIRIQKNEIAVRGVLYYTLRNGEFSVTRKMILIE